MDSIQDEGVMKEQDVMTCEWLQVRQGVYNWRVWKEWILVRQPTESKRPCLICCRRIFTDVISLICSAEAEPSVLKRWAGGRHLRFLWNITGRLWHVLRRIWRRRNWCLRRRLCLLNVRQLFDSWMTGSDILTSFLWIRLTINSLRKRCWYWCNMRLLSMKRRWSL